MTMDKLDEISRKRKEANRRIQALKSKVYDAFLHMEKATYSDGALSKQVKELIAVGTADDVAGSAHALGEVIRHAGVLDIPDRDHMRAVGDKVFKTGVLDFLRQRP